MKLIKIKIVNFGQFSDFTFDLLKSDINVFLGANEAGKSTIVAFIKQVMFGFHLAKHSSDFFEDYKPLARVSPMGGSLFFEDEDGEHFELERLYASGKGSKLGTLTVKCNNQIVPESAFFDQIKNIDGDFYADSFIFNQDMLAKVSQIKQTDLLERIYYLGASNSDKLIDLRDEFAKNASGLFKKAGKNPPVNQLLSQIQDQRVKVADTENEFSNFQELNNDFRMQHQLLQKKEQQLKESQKEYDNLTRLQKALPDYRKLKQLQGQVEPVSFDHEQYQLAQNLSIQEQNLLKQQQNLTKRISNFDKEQQDFSQEEKLVEKKPELLQWQSEYQTCLEQKRQIDSAKQQLLSLNPALNKIVGFSQEQIVNLQKDYQNLPPNDKQDRNKVNKNTSHYFLLIGGLVAVIGLVLLMTNARATGLVAMAIGIFAALLGLYQQKEEKSRKEKYHQAQDERRAFNKKYGLDVANLDLPNLLTEWRQYQLQEQAQNTNQQHQEELVRKMTDLATQLSRVLNQEVNADFRTVLAAVNQLGNNLNQFRRQQEQMTNLQNELTDNGKELRETQLKLKAVLARAQVNNLKEFALLQTKKEEQNQLKTRIEILQSNLQDDMVAIEKLAQDTQASQAKIQTLAQQISQHQEIIHNLQGKIAEIKVKMDNLANSTAVFDEKQNLANIKTRFKNLSTEYLANLLISKWIGRALDLASNERFPKMLLTAREYLRLLTDNRYNDIDIANKLTVTRFDGKKIKVQYLSRGTSEQLYFALKLAFVQQIKDQINLPILIDDSFVNFDDQRVEQIKQLLKQIASNNQVLIFTAQSNLVNKLGLKPLTFTKGTEDV